MSITVVDLPVSLQYDDEDNPVFSIITDDKVFNEVIIEGEAKKTADMATEDHEKENITSRPNVGPDPDFSSSGDDLISSLPTTYITTVRPAASKKIPVPNIDTLSNAAKKSTPKRTKKEPPPPTTTKKSTPKRTSNVSPPPPTTTGSRFKKTTIEERNDLLLGLESANTKKNTKYAVKLFREWLEVNGHSVEFENLGDKDLNKLLEVFYTEVRSKKI